MRQKNTAGLTADLWPVRSNIGGEYRGRPITEQLSFEHELFTYFWMSPIKPPLIFILFLLSVGLMPEGGSAMFLPVPDWRDDINMDDGVEKVFLL